MITNNSIKNRIIKDVEEEFAHLRNELQIHLKPDFDVTKSKKDLETYIPNEIVYKSEVLLSTVLNYLMEDAKEKIKSADVKLQNKFYDENFRKRIDEWTKQLENKLKLEPDIVKYSFDPRLKYGLITSGTTFIAGVGASMLLTSSFIGAIVSGLVTITLSAITFKGSYDKTSPKAIESIKNDIENYLKITEKQVYDWLVTVVNVFKQDFHNDSVILSV